MYCFMRIVTRYYALKIVIAKAANKKATHFTLNLNKELHWEKEVTMHENLYCKSSDWLNIFLSKWNRNSNSQLTLIYSEIN